MATGNKRLSRVASHVTVSATECGAMTSVAALAAGVVVGAVGMRMRGGNQANAAIRAALAKEEAKAAVGRQEPAPHTVSTLDQLRGVLPGDFDMKTVESGLVNEEGTPDAPKVIDHLDVQMMEFIERSPFIQLGTADSTGLPFVSPKGDTPGFVVAQERAVLIPDRPGNNLAMGLQNMIANPQVGLLFEIPNTTHTLRVGGRATLSNDPALLEMLNTHSQREYDEHMAALLCIKVEVEYAFFHCAKAYLRSRLWEPESWPEEEFPVSFAPYFGPPAMKGAIDKGLQGHYDAVKEAVRAQRDS